LQCAVEYVAVRVAVCCSVLRCVVEYCNCAICVLQCAFRVVCYSML